MLRGSIEEQRLDAYYFQVTLVEIKGHATEGVDMVDDMLRLTDAYGPDLTLANNREFVDIEQYRVFEHEQVEGVLLSLLAVGCVVAFITVNLHLSLMILFSIALVDYYLVALIYFWGMTMNMFTGVAMVLSLGIAVDYSTHIAHTFFMT